MVGVAAAMVIRVLVTATGALAVVAATTHEPKANIATGCNGYVELCVQPLTRSSGLPATTR